MGTGSTGTPAESSTAPQGGLPALIAKVTAWALSLKPVRVWFHFLERRGLMLADSVTYRALFSVFAGVFLGFSFAALWLSTLVPFALGGARPDPEGVGGTPYPVFWLDLAIVLPALVTVGVLLLRDRPAGRPLAVVALIKIVTLFAALWAGPVVALVTSADVHLGPDAGPSLLLLGASSWLAVRWLRAFTRAR